MILEKFDKVKGHLFIRSRTTNSRILLNIPVNWFPVFFVINKPEIRRICFIHDEIISINQSMVIWIFILLHANLWLILRQMVWFRRTFRYFLSDAYKLVSSGFLITWQDHVLCVITNSLNKYDPLICHLQLTKSTFLTHFNDSFSFILYI